MEFVQDEVTQPSSGTSSPEGRKGSKKLHDEEKKAEVEATSSDKSVGPRKRPAGRNSAKNSRPSQGFTDLMDRMYQETDLFAKRWEELQSLTSSYRLVKEIRDFYTTVDEQADKKRQELQAIAGSSSASKKGTFKDLQGNLALTARKIYECAEGVPDEDKCRAAADFVEEVLSKFKRTNVRVMILLRRCLFSMEFACPKLRSDREEVMAAVQQDGLALQLACEYLQSDKEVVMTAVRNNGLALQLACEYLQSDKEVVMAAVGNNGLALQFASEELQSDREVVFAAVQQDGRACLFASEDIRSDKELAMVTAEKDGTSHQFASDELNYDRHFNDVLQLTDVSPAIIDIYRTLKAFIHANQTLLSQSTSLLELLDKSHKLQQVVALHLAMDKFVRVDDVWLRELIKGGVDLNQECRHPQHGSLTPLRHAVTLDSPAIIKLLCEEGADLCRKPSPIRYAHDLGSTANAAFAALAQYPECFRAPDITVEIIRRLANAGADINFADQLGRTALHFNAVEGHVEVVRALIENSARLDQRDSEGKTPLNLATEAGAPEEMVQLLDKSQKLQEEEERRLEKERAREQLEQQKREAEQRLVEELQRERDNVQKAKVEKWQRLKRNYPIPSFLQNYINEVSEDAEADARDRFVNVAMLGDSGTGKSSLIKVILKHFGVDLPPDQMPKVSMEGDGTLLPTRFPLEKLGQVSLWDLPGQGTSKIPSVTYLCNMGLKYFDAVCIVTDGRWSEGDTNLLTAIHYAGIRCCVVRSKVDLAVDAGVEDKGWGLAETLSHLHQQLQQQTRLKPHRIHLLTSRDRFWKDFGSVDNFCKHLQEEVEASLKEKVAELTSEEAPQEDITVEIIRRLAHAGADINFTDQLGRTALHFYAVAGHLEVVRALIENSARLDQRDSEGKTPLDLATEAGAPEEFSKLLEYVELYIGLGGQPIALQTLILAEPLDVVSFLRHYVRDMKFKKRERVSYFAIQVSIGGDKVAESNTSWEALGKPKTIFVTLGGNFRGDRGSTKKFLKIAARPGADADNELRGHLEDFQDPDAVDEERGETAAYKAARNGDVDKLELLFLACANFDLRDRGGATALFIASQSGHLAAVRFLLDHQAQVDLALDTEATPLYVACQNGHLQVAEVLLAFGAKPNFQTNDKATPLFIAAQMGHYRIVQKLLEFNGDIKLANRTEATPLFIAAQNDHRDIVICLLLAGSDINARTAGGASPTYIAAQKGCMNVLPLLMEAPGVDANLSANDGATPILIAAQNGHQGAVRFLLEKKVDVTKAMNSGATALFVAAQNGYLDVVQDLVTANSSLVNMCLQNGTSPVYVAAQNGHLVVVEYLQQKGADTKKKSCGGASPFFIAAQNGHVTVARFFLDVEHKSLRPDIETLLTEQTDDKSAPLLVASQNGHLDLVQFLTDELKKLPITEERKQQLIDHQKNGGASALYLASQNGHESVVCHLIQLGASVNQALETKETPLFIASQGGHTRVVQHLLEARGDINQGKHDQTTPLYIASQNNHTDTFRLLLHARAEPNVQNANGATALFISSQKGHNDIVMELLDANADPKLPIQSGACPLYIAAMKGQVDVCRILLDCGRADPNQTPGHGTTALLISVRNGHEKVFNVLIEDPAVDVNKADLGGNIPLLTAIKVNMWLAVEKLISRCAKVDHGIFDDGIVILRGLANTLFSIAGAASAKAVQSSEIPPSGYPHADASAESLEQYREFFKKTSEEAKTLLHQLHRVDEGLRNLANENLSPGTKQQVEQLRKLFHVPDPDKGSWTRGNLQVAALFQSWHNVLKASRHNDRLLDPGEAREELLMAGKQVLRACSLMRVYIDCVGHAFLPFLNRCSDHSCGTDEQDRMQQLITKQICSELQKASQLEGGLESLFKSMGTDFTTTPTKPVDSGAKAMLESKVENFKLGPGRPSVDTKSA